MALKPTQSFEDRLGDALEILLGRGVDSLEGFAAGLNELYVYGPNGEHWTPELLAAELARLGR